MCRIRSWNREPTRQSTARQPSKGGYSFCCKQPSSSQDLPMGGASSGRHLSGHHLHRWVPTRRPRPAHWPQRLGIRDQKRDRTHSGVGLRDPSRVDHRHPRHKGLGSQGSISKSSSRMQSPHRLQAVCRCLSQGVGMGNDRRKEACKGAPSHAGSLGRHRSQCSHMDAGAHHGSQCRT